MKVMKVTVAFTTSVPDGLTEAQINEWLLFSLRASGCIALDNPLGGVEIVADCVTWRNEDWMRGGKPMKYLNADWRLKVATLHLALKEMDQAGLQAKAVGMNRAKPVITVRASAACRHLEAGLVRRLGAADGQTHVYAAPWYGCQLEWAVKP